MKVIELHALVLDEHVADLGCRPHEDVQPAGRQSGLRLELREQERRERRLRGRLEHDRAAGGERRRDLVRDEVEREVERRDRADDADRPAQREAELPGSGLRPVHRHHLAGERARLHRGVGVGRHGPRDLDPRRLQRLAGLGADQSARPPRAGGRGSPRPGRGSRHACGRAAAPASPPQPRRPPAAPRRRRPVRRARRLRRRTANESRASRPSRPTRRRSGASARPPSSPRLECTRPRSMLFGMSARSDRRRGPLADREAKRRRWPGLAATSWRRRC